MTQRVKALASGGWAASMAVPYFVRSYAAMAWFSSGCMGSKNSVAVPQTACEPEMSSHGQRLKPMLHVYSGVGSSTVGGVSGRPCF